MKTHYYTQDIINICTDKHLTVDEIFQELQKLYPEVGRSSIYRNVEQLSDKGDLKKVVGIGKKALFEANIGNHIHIIDESNGEIIDLPLDVINFDKLPENFNINQADIKLFGNFSK